MGRVELCCFVAVIGVAAGCGESGVPGITGELTLGSCTRCVLDRERADRIFVGAYSAQQIAPDGWPRVWAEALYEDSLSVTAGADYQYTFLTGSSERLYIYAFLNQDGSEETDPGCTQEGDSVIADVLGRYRYNPIAPVDGVLREIDVVLNVPMEPPC